MGERGEPGLISVKGSVFHDPWLRAGAAAVLGALLVTNVYAFVQGTEAPWLLFGVIIADMAVIGAGVALAAREVLVAEHRSEASEERLAAIVDSAMDAIVTVDASQTIVLFNVAAEQVFRCPRAEALGGPLERFIPVRFRGAHHSHVERFGRTGITSRRMGDVTTLWGLRADGTEFPLEASISQAGAPGRRYYTVILRDVTLRKDYEDRLHRQSRELRELSARVLEAREEEKTRIARELHDELGQLLTALKMDLSALKDAPDGDRAAKITAMNRVLDQTVASTRRIAADLRPLMLDDLGLAEAAGWLVQDFGQRSGVAARIELAGAVALDDLPKAVAIAVYRALQESLTNIARHAGARNAWVTLGAADGVLQVEIEDDGRGIAPEDSSKPRSLGLKGMRERLVQVGGTLEVARAPRGGTRVRLRVPLRGIAEEGAR
jgi:PAS domain S-box-containing protein